jgi:RNA-directed DNA polymerase
MSFIINLLKSLDISHHELAELMLIAPKAYKTYKIPKRTGGTRTISQPTPEIKNIQRLICSLFLSEFAISDVATAYRKGVSIKDNATPHLGKNFILKMDFVNFFPSLKPDDLRAALEKQDCVLSSLERYILERFLFKNTTHGLRLTIGAPSSPLISNIIMNEIDEEILAYASKQGINFTRYADDLTFSFDEISLSAEIQTKVETTLSKMFSPRLELNIKKTHLIGRGRSQRVTGLVLTHEKKISVGRYTRKRVRAMCHNLSNNKLERNDIPVLHGLISYLRDIEPDFCLKIQIKYGDQFFIDLARQAFSITKSGE